jgi:hypothetical protein
VKQKRIKETKGKKIKEKKKEDTLPHSSRCSHKGAALFRALHCVRENQYNTGDAQKEGRLK